MRAEAFFGACWRGEGEVTGPFGRVLRRFSSQFSGSWSELDRAFHSEELVTYEGGATMRRPWVVHTEEDGLLIGYDAYQVGRMRVQNTDDGFVIRYDRPRLGPDRNVSRATLHFREAQPDRLVARGDTRILGFPIARMQARFERV